MSRLWPLGGSSDSELQRTRLWFADKLKRPGTAPAKTFLHCVSLHCIELIAFTIFFVMGDTSTRRSTHRTGLSARRDCNSSYVFGLHPTHAIVFSAACANTANRPL